MNDDVQQPYLPAGLPIPVPESDDLSAPFWAALRKGRLLVQRCGKCHTWQFGPEWLCHNCHHLDPDWVEVKPEGRIFSWERVWHPSHAALSGHPPYIAVLVELPQAGGVRLVGNLLGDPMRQPEIGAVVEGFFEHHRASQPPYSLLHWTCRDT
jgi:uncharacterized OB-fold protein